MTCGGGGLVGRGWRLLGGMVAAGGGAPVRRERQFGYWYQRWYGLMHRLHLVWPLGATRTDLITATVRAWHATPLVTVDGWT